MNIVPRTMGLLFAVVLTLNACTSDGSALTRTTPATVLPSPERMTPATVLPSPERMTPATVLPSPERTTPATVRPSPERTTAAIVLAEPSMPSLITDGIPGWENTEVGSLCIKVKTEGDFDKSPERGTPSDYVGWAMAMFDVPVVRQGCDAQLAVELAAETSAASYGTLGRCWNGLTGTADATLSMPGRSSVTGTHDVYYAPPSSILKGQCNKTSSVETSSWEWMLKYALGELFGWRFWLALEAGGDNPEVIDWDYKESVGDDLVNDAVTALINSRLSGADPDDQLAAAYFAGTLATQGSDQTRTLLEPVVPYLIRALALEDARNPETNGHLDDGRCDDGEDYDTFASLPLRCSLGRALRYITGETLDLRADVWWDWWQERPPAFNTAGSLGQARAGHTATLLPDGRVLVVGGENYAGRLDSAEIWDPADGTFSPSGSLGEARAGHTATLLPDGRVLVAGGLSKQSDDGRAEALASAELWDPASDAFSAAGSLVWARRSHTATHMPDGRVLFVGGIGRRVGSESHSGDRELSRAEQWNPASATFSAAEWLEESRSEHIATLLADGRVLVIGGDGYDAGSAELWDPSSGTFSAAGSLIEGRQLHTATLLADGRVLVAGGRGGDDSAELWDPSSATFSAAGSLIEGRYDHTATLLADGRVLIVGGADSDPVALAELWDPASGTFSPADSLIEGRSEHTATLLPDGRVLVVGGYGDTGFLSTAELRGS